MKSITITLTDNQVYCLFQSMGEYSYAAEHWSIFNGSRSVLTHAKNLGADGGISFYDGSYEKITLEEAFERMLAL